MVKSNLQQQADRKLLLRANEDDRVSFPGAVPRARFDYLLFDLDGTLVDSAPDIAAAANAARAALDLPPLPEEAIRAFIGDGVDALVERAIGTSGGAGALARAKEAYRAHYERGLLDRTRPYPGVERALAALRDAGRRMAVVTNKPGRWSLAILRGLGLDRYFGAVVGGDGGAGRKPSAGPFEAALRALAEAAGEEAGRGAAPLPRERALVIGDGRNDVLGARAAGIAVCAVTYGIGDVAELRALGPDYLIESIEELPPIAT